MSYVAVPELSQLRRRRSTKWRAHDPDVLPLPVAEMDFELAEPIKRALHDAVGRSDAGYAWPADGLGEAFASFAYDRWSWSLDPSAVTPVADVGVGCVELLRVMCRPDDGVVINTPVYAPFFEWIDEVGCTAVHAPLAGNRLDFDALERAFEQGPAVYLLCNPHNPVGRAHSADELATVVELASRYGVRVISDEVHAPLVLPGASFTPLLTIDGAPQLATSLMAASKTWNLAGLKCAQVVTASPPMRDVTERLPAALGVRVGHFGVIAAIAAYDECRDWLDSLIATLDSRRTLLRSLLAEHLPYVGWTPPEATYLAWLDCSALGSRDLPYERFREAGVALDPGVKFGAHEGFCRLNFATSEAILTEAIERMTTAPR